MTNEFILGMSKDGKWSMRKEPFAVIECPTEDAYNTLVETTGKQVPGKVKYINMQAACPVCLDKILRYYSYCPMCGQKLNWD